MSKLNMVRYNCYINISSKINVITAFVDIIEIYISEQEIYVTKRLETTDLRRPQVVIRINDTVTYLIRVEGYERSTFLSSKVKLRKLQRRANSSILQASELRYVATVARKDLLRPRLILQQTKSASTYRIGVDVSLEIKFIGQCEIALSCRGDQNTLIPILY